MNGKIYITGPEDELNLGYFFDCERWDSYLESNKVKSYFYCNHPNEKKKKLRYLSEFNQNETKSTLTESFLIDNSGIRTHKLSKIPENLAPFCSTIRQFRIFLYVVAFKKDQNLIFDLPRYGITFHLKSKNQLVIPELDNMIVLRIKHSRMESL